MLDLFSTFGVAFLVLAPVGVLTAFLIDPTSDVWVANRALFMGAWFLYIFFSRTLVETILSRYSVLYGNMNPVIKRHDANFMVFLVASVSLWIPAGAFLCFHVFRLGPVDYIPVYGGVTRCFILMGVAGEFVDLLSRHRLSIDLLVHHMIEIIGGGIMADSSISIFEPGFLFLVMITVLGRGSKACLVFDHVSREGSSDAVFPEWCLSKEGRRSIFRAVFAVTVYADVVQPVVSVSSYVIAYFEELSEINRIWLPCLTAVFIAVDVPLLRFFLDKTRASPSPVYPVPEIDTKENEQC